MLAMAKTPATQALQTTLAFLRGTAELACDHARALETGCVVRSPSLPQVWGINHLRLFGFTTYERAVALAEEHLADLPYRQLIVEHEDSVRRLQEPLRADGWTFDRDVLMVLARPSDRQSDTDGVVEIDGDAASVLMRQWVADDPKMTADALDQVVEATGREARVRS